MVVLINTLQNSKMYYNNNENKKRKGGENMDVFVIQQYKVSKRLLVDSLHELGLRGNTTTAKNDLWHRLKIYLEKNGRSVTPIKSDGIVSDRSHYSTDLLKAYEKKIKAPNPLTESQSLISSWFIKKFCLSNTVSAVERLRGDKIVIVPEATATGALQSLIENGI